MDAESNRRSTSPTNYPGDEMPREEIFDCSYPDCDYTSIWKENVGCHERGHNPTKQWDISCQVCPQNFRSLVSFFHHMSSQHSNKLFCPWCLFLGKDSTDYKAHILAHDGTPKSSRPKNTTKGTTKLCCGICFEIFNDGSSLWRHNKRNLCNPNSLTNSVPKPAEIQDDSQESIEDPDFASATAADESSIIIPSADEAQIQGTAELSMEKVSIEGETFYSCTICGHKTKRRDNLKTHFLVHTDHKPFGCIAKGCTYRAKSFQQLKKHSRTAHQINNLRLQKIAKTPNENLGSGKDCDNQTPVNASSSSSFSMAFACMLCEFIGDSELAALDHAQQHIT